jgi:hypothetical protein
MKQVLSLLNDQLSFHKLCLNQIERRHEYNSLTRKQYDLQHQKLTSIIFEYTEAIDILTAHRNKNLKQYDTENSRIQNQDQS